MEAVHAELVFSKAMNVTESHAETESDLETVGSKHLLTKRACGMAGSEKQKNQKKSDIKMSSEELLETKRRISNALITAVREMKHDNYKWGDGRKKIQTSSLVVFEIPSFGSGMQIVENHGTQKQIKLEKHQIDLLGTEEILAVFPNLRSEVQTLDSSNSQEKEHSFSTQVVVKKCQDVQKRRYPRSCENANPWMRAPQFYFCDVQMESVRIIVSKFRISVSVKTSIINRPWGPNMSAHPLDHLPESWTDIHNHHSMNPFCPGIRRPVRPPPNGWFPSQDSV
jgi:hypothetical protein